GRPPTQSDASRWRRAGAHRAGRTRDRSRPPGEDAVDTVDDLAHRRTMSGRPLRGIGRTALVLLVAAATGTAIGTAIGAPAGTTRGAAFGTSHGVPRDLGAGILLAHPLADTVVHATYAATPR